LSVVAVITFPGSNCDADLRHALSACGLAVRAVWHKETSLGRVDAVMLPGGFSYGDYLRCGAIARFSPILPEVARFAAGGGPVLGICNGFQILCEAGLLPGVLLRNAGLSFVCEDVALDMVGRDTPFTRSGPTRLRLPIAHAEGRWFAEGQLLARVEGEGQVVFRYAEGAPNGAVNDVAGVCNARGNVLGMMPHPERAVEAAVGGTDGAWIFDSLAAGLA
jgi:phosphoribosylformylglycinamidine synthase I